jgi:hypothetical protein
MYQDAQQLAFKMGKCGTNPGELNKIIKTCEDEYNLPTGTISFKTIQSRVRRNNCSGRAEQRLSPLSDIEPIVMGLCIKMAEIGEPATKKDVLEMVESMIKDSPFYLKYLSQKQSLHLRNPKNNEDCHSLVGNAWYRNFMKRYKTYISRNPGRMRDIKRFTWCTYEHFEQMYKCVYHVMVEAGVAEKLTVKKYYDVDGNEVFNADDAFGRGTLYKVTNPERIVFVDETGCNTSQIDDGQIGGQLFIFPKNGSCSGKIGAVTDLHFTVLCFMSGLGIPIMCAVIMKSEKHVSDIPISWKLGIDIQKNLHDGATKIELIENNSGSQDSAMIGGPVCYFEGNVIPCFVATTPKASITSSLLADMLKFMDD